VNSEKFDIHIEVWEDFTQVKYYALKVSGEKTSILDNFFKRYEDSEEYSRSIAWIDNWLTQIGEYKTANNEWFRPNSKDQPNVKKLPPPTSIIREAEIDFDDNQLKLRLYCIKMSDNAVILVDGGIKSSLETNKSEDLKHKNMFAKNIAGQIEKQLQAGNLSCTGKNIEFNEKFGLSYYSSKRERLN